MLINGQTFATSCPYLWSWCDGTSCDGCEADRGQGNPSATPPWAEETSTSERHDLVQRAANAPDATLMTELFADAWSWRRHILGTT